MINFPACNILSTDQFTRQDIEQLWTTASIVKPYAKRELRTNVLQGTILSNLFFEPSTRTRLSFSSAYKLLGGVVNETTEISTTSSVKGESLCDFAKVVAEYCDIAVIRHPDVGSAAEYAKCSNVPVINAGDGANEHPTQALLDIYTMEQELEKYDKTIDRVTLACIGDLKYGRTVHSLLKLLALFKDVTIHLISPRSLQLPNQFTEKLSEHGHRIEYFNRLEPGIENVDVLYVTRIQEERLSEVDQNNLQLASFQINRTIYEQVCTPETVILHPLPRNSRSDTPELHTDLNDHPNLAIFRQVANGLTIRMALFALIMDVVEKISYSTY